MTTIQLRSLGGIFCLVLAGSLLPASADEPPTQNLNPLVVTAGPVAGPLHESFQSVSVIGRAEIEASPAATLAELLAQIGGVEVRRRGAPGVQADIGIRGTAFEQTLILLNGIPLGDPQTGHHNLNVPVPLEHIARIEVIKGPGGITYGGNATGGLINIITREPDGKEFGAALRAGSYDAREYGAFGGIATAGRGHLLSASRFKTDGHEPGRRADADLAQASYTGHARIARGRVSWGLGAENREFGAWKFYTADFPDQREMTRSRLAYVAGDFQAGNWALTPKLYWRGHDDWFRTLVGTTPYINEHETDVRGLRLGAQTGAAGGTTSLGAARVHERIDSNALDDHRRHETTLWAAHRRNIGERTGVEVSLGAVDYSDHGTELLPSAALRYRFTPQWSGYISSARSARIPSYTEQFLLTSGNRGNPDLEPERSAYHEAGARMLDGNQSLNLALFYRRTRDLIDWARSPGEVAWQADNFDGHRTRGAEVEWQWRPVDAGPLSMFRVSLTRLDTDLDDRGLSIKYALDYARSELAASGVWQLSSNLSLSLRARHQRRVSGDSATLVGARLAWQRARTQLFVEGSNLLDEEVIEAGFAPLPGRWLYGGARVRF